MKTLLKAKVSIALLTTALICIISCKKENENTDNGPLQSAQKAADVTAGLKANAINYRASSEKSHQLLLNIEKVVKQNITKLTLERNLHLSKPEVSSVANSGGKSVIHVPEDFSTLQEAVDRSMDGGKIIID